MRRIILIVLVVLAVFAAVFLARQTRRSQSVSASGDVVVARPTPASEPGAALAPPNAELDQQVRKVLATSPQPNVVPETPTVSPPCNTVDDAGGCSEPDPLKPAMSTPSKKSHFP